MVSGTISLRSQRFFSSFPRGTCSLSVINEYLALRRGRRRFMRSFTCIALLRSSYPIVGFRLRVCHPLWSSFPEASPSLLSEYWSPTTPGAKPPVWATSAFVRHYLRNRFRFLFLTLLRCFTSGGSRIRSYFIQSGTIQYKSYQVIPFGDPRVNACLRLTEAYRSLPRPSSPTGTKASTVRPLNLTLS
jgi:hypothetical protein